MFIIAIMISMIALTTFLELLSIATLILMKRN